MSSDSKHEKKITISLPKDCNNIFLNNKKAKSFQNENFMDTFTFSIALP